MKYLAPVWSGSHYAIVAEGENMHTTLEWFQKQMLARLAANAGKSKEDNPHSVFESMADSSNALLDALGHQDCDTAVARAVDVAIQALQIAELAMAAGQVEGTSKALTSSARPLE
jgi:hypothetical protein